MIRPAERCNLREINFDILQYSIIGIAIVFDYRRPLLLRNNK